MREPFELSSARAGDAIHAGRYWFRGMRRFALRKESKLTEVKIEAARCNESAKALSNPSQTLGEKRSAGRSEPDIQRPKMRQQATTDATFLDLRRRLPPEIR